MSGQALIIRIVASCRPCASDFHDLTPGLSDRKATKDSRGQSKSKGDRDLRDIMHGSGLCVVSQAVGDRDGDRLGQGMT